MADLLDKAILLAMGLEKKIKETAEDLEDLGKVETSDEEVVEGEVVDDGPDAEEELGARKEFENRLVEGGVKVLGELVSILKECKDKAEGTASEQSEKISEKLNLATKADFEVVMEMARIAREKVDKLEKRLDELEKKQQTATKEKSEETE